MNKPIFIVGANRSGTTLLRLILNAHSGIAIPEELNFFNSRIAGTDIEDWSDTQLTTNYFDFLIEKQWGLLVKQGLDIDGIRRSLAKDEPFTARHLYQTVLESWAMSQGKPRWGEKTPSNLFYADILVDMFPEAQFIHLIRDPRAGVASMQRVEFFSNDISFNALTRHKSMTNGRDILEQSVPPTQRKTLRYEDLVQNPESVVADICAFLGERYEPRMLDFHKSAGHYMKDEAANGFNRKATHPISPDVAHEWRKQLSPQEIALVERVCREDMNRFGYPIEGPSLSIRDRLVSYAKETYWHWQCWRNRDIRHYTVLHPMLPRLRSRLRHSPSGAGRLKKLVTPA